MSETTATRSAGGGLPAQLAWVVGASALGTIMPNVILMVSAGLGMVVVVGFGLDQTLGVPVYAAALAGGIALYWAGIHVGIAIARRYVTVPWMVWPALAAWPVVWMIAATLGDPAGVLEPTPAVLGGLGMVGAWFTLGKRRWSSESESLTA